MITPNTSTATNIINLSKLILVIIPRKSFVKCGPIVTKLDMEGAGYDTCIINKYHGNRSKGQGHRNCEKHIIIDNSETTHRRNVKLPKYS